MVFAPPYLSIILIATTRIPLVELWWNFIFYYLWKVCGENKIHLKHDKHVGYFSKGRPHLSKYLVSSSEIKNISHTMLKITKDNLCLITSKTLLFLKQHKRYSRKRQATVENIVRLLRFSCCNTKSTNHNQNIEHKFLLNNSNNGKANELQRYVYMHIAYFFGALIDIWTKTPLPVAHVSWSISLCTTTCSSDQE